MKKVARREGLDHAAGSGPWLGPTERGLMTSEGWTERSAYSHPLVAVGRSGRRPRATPRAGTAFLAGLDKEESGAPRGTRTPNLLVRSQTVSVSTSDYEWLQISIDA